MFVSVVMPALNSAEVLRDQLVSLTRQDYSHPWELVIADNGSTDATVAVAHEFAAQLPLRVVDAGARRGDMAARNIAVPDTSGGLIIFCDSDDALGARWLSSHVDQLTRTDLSVGPFEMRTDMDRAATGVSVTAPMRGVYGYLPYGLSANMGVTRETFDALEGFDETFRVGYDVEFCWRAQTKGFSLGAAHDAVVTKRKRSNSGGVWEQHRAFGMADVKLYTRYRTDGMPQSLGRAFKTYGWLVVHLVDLLSEDRRLTWLGVAAQRWGRIEGSVRTRTVYL